MGKCISKTGGVGSGIYFVSALPSGAFAAIDGSYNKPHVDLMDAIT